MTNEILLSIVIPTKDRYYTLFNLVDKLMEWDSQEFEVIVQDNTEDNSSALEHFAKYVGDNRFKYAHEAKFLVAIDNFTRGFKAAKGKYISFLGDDDGIIFQAIQLCRWMDEHKIDSANIGLATYNWPELRMKYYGYRFAGTLMLNGNSGGITFIDPINELKKTLHKGGIVITKLPRAYHGIVSRKCLEDLYTAAGTYFPGPVADMSNAVANSFFCKSHIFVDYPLVIAGASGDSMAGRSAMHKAHGRIEEEKSLPPATITNWSSVLPRYWAPQTIWPESALKALDNTNNSHYKVFMNLNRVFAALLMYTSGIRGEVLKHVCRITRFERLPLVFAKIAYNFAELAGARIATLTKAVILFSGILKAPIGQEHVKAQSIGDAISILEERTRKSEFVWMQNA